MTTLPVHSDQRNRLQKLWNERLARLGLGVIGTGDAKPVRPTKRDARKQKPAKPPHHG